MKKLKKIIPISKSHPKIAKEAHGWNPSEYTFGYGKPLEWKCPKGHIYLKTPNQRTNKGSGCPFCANSKVLPGFNDLKTVFPNIAKEAHGWNPANYFPASADNMQWRCKAGHIFQSRIYSRTGKAKAGCPYCSNKKVLPGFNDLLTRFPEIAKEADGWDPTGYIFGSVSRKKWLCKNGHSFNTNIRLRTLKGTGCPYCSFPAKKVLPGFNDLKTKFPEIAKEADGWDPRQTLPGTNKSSKWKCKLGHKYVMAIGTRTTQGCGCPYCSIPAKKLLSGFNDLGTKAPLIAKTAFGWNPQKILYGSGKTRKWKCDLGHIFSCSIDNRIKGNGCPFCAGKRVLIGFNDLVTTHPHLADEAYKWNPEKYTFGSRRTGKMKWRCPKGHIYSATISARSNVGTGCPRCAKSGFDQTLPGFLYLVERPGQFKYGITNYFETRVGDDHRRSGWKLIEAIMSQSGIDVLEAEGAIRRGLKNKGIPTGSKAFREFFDGYSEAFQSVDLEVFSLVDLFSKLELEIPEFIKVKFCKI